MRIRRAVASDAAALAAFGERTFRQTFGAQNRAEDMAAYTRKTYGEAQQRAEIEDGNAVTLLVEADAELIAFAQLRRSGSRFGDIELARFYVGQEWHGRGVAQALIDAVFEAARELSGSQIWLSVWEHNPRGIAFYRKCGFVDAGTQPFVVGNDVQTDRIMVRELEL